MNRHLLFRSLVVILSVGWLATTWLGIDAYLTFWQAVSWLALVLAFWSYPGIRSFKARPKA